jgi:hypothetical protein
MDWQLKATRSNLATIPLSACVRMTYPRAEALASSPSGSKHYSQGSGKLDGGRLLGQDEAWMPYRFPTLGAGGFAQRRAL